MRSVFIEALRKFSRALIHHHNQEQSLILEHTLDKTTAQG